MPHGARGRVRTCASSGCKPDALPTWPRVHGGGLWNRTTAARQRVVRSQLDKHTSVARHPPCARFNVVHNVLVAANQRPSPLGVAAPSSGRELDIVRASGRITPARPCTLARMHLISLSFPVLAHPFCVALPSTDDATLEVVVPVHSGVLSCPRVAVLAMRLSRIVGSALLDHVDHVVAASAEEEVCWITARGIVAGVTDVHPFRCTGSVMKLPRNYVGAPHLTIELEGPILAPQGLSPKPAVVRAKLFNFPPKSLHDFLSG